MIRIILFLVVVGALSLGVAWFADRPGDVVVTWQGMRIETSLMVVAAAVLAAMVVLAALWSIVRAILRSPATFARMRRERRGARAYEAISHGLIAVGSDDIDAARKHAATVNKLAPGEPLALLLNAQSAQLAGDREAAGQTFRTLASRDDTKALGLHGLFIEARRRGDHDSARAHAEEAVRTAPSLGWAGRAVLEARCQAGDWAGALALLEQNKTVMDKATYRRQRAVLLTGLATAIEDTDRDSAKAHAIEAAKLAPNLVPAAALAGRLHAESGETRKATRIIDRAWRVNPHPDLAHAFAGLRSGESARERLKRIEYLAKKAVGHIESDLAVARAAIDAQEFAKARASLANYLAAPTKRVALLMAELERAERNDEGRAREWTARAVNAAPDPQWTTDGHVSKHWLPASPSGRLDAFEWRVPLTGDFSTPPLIEPEPPPVVVPIKPILEVAEGDPRGGDYTPPVRAETPSAASPAAETVPKPAPIIPLVHAPDDPGPDAVEESEKAEQPHAGGWGKIFG
jgi:HemY protein